MNEMKLSETKKSIHELAEEIKNERFEEARTEADRADCGNTRSSYKNEYSFNGGVGRGNGVSKPNANSSGMDSLTPANNAINANTANRLLTHDDSIYTSLVADLDRFLAQTDGFEFAVRDFDDFAGIPKEDRETQVVRSVILGRYCENGRLERLRYARYRGIEQGLEPINWQDADIEDVLKLNYPLDMQKVIKTYKGSILVCAGVSHAGKTALAYQFLLRNMDNPMGVHLFTTSDMDKVEIKERMLRSGFVIPNPAPFQVWDMPPNPADLIQKDAINILDYVDLTTEL